MPPKSCWGCFVSKQNLLITNTLKRLTTLSESWLYIRTTSFEFLKNVIMNPKNRPDNRWRYGSSAALVIYCLLNDHGLGSFSSFWGGSHELL